MHFSFLLFFLKIIFDIGVRLLQPLIKQIIPIVVKDSFTTNLWNTTTIEIVALVVVR